MFVWTFGVIKNVIASMHGSVVALVKNASYKFRI